MIAYHSQCWLQLNYHLHLLFIVRLLFDVYCIFGNLHNEFLIFLKSGDPDSHLLSRLQILYQARGRKIDELNLALQEMQNASTRESRILQHRIRLVQGETCFLL